MFVRSLASLESTPFFVEWGAGTSHRLLTVADGMGFTICHTVVRKKTESLLQYQDHLEACYCVAGSGEVEDMDGNIFKIRSGDMYALNKHDKHYLRGSETEDMILISVFNPALQGTETHALNDNKASSY